MKHIDIKNGRFYNEDCFDATKEIPAIASINLNRRWVCIEKEKEYADLAIERIRNHSNEWR